MAFRLRCPACRKTFPFDPATEKMPEFCRLKECGARIGTERADDDIVMPFIRASSRTATIDATYRQVEEGSNVRAQIAADMAGTSVADMSDLKITNFKEAKHQGEVAAMPVVNDVTRFMEQNKVGGFQGNGVEYGAQVMQGAHPNAGARMRSTLHSLHGKNAGGGAVSDCPANETMQPGYRRRG